MPLISGYRVKYSPTSLDGNETILQLTSYNLSIEITGLRKFHNYSIQIMAFTSMNGSYSNVTIAITAEDGMTSHKYFDAVD